MQETQETRARCLDREDPLDKSLATHSSILAWRRRSLAGYSPWGRKQLDMTEQLSTGILI